jgi:serine/threonine protein kinase
MAEMVNSPQSIWDYGFDGLVSISRRETDAPDALEIFSTIFWEIRKGDEVFFANMPRKTRDIRLEEVTKVLERIPDSRVYPQVPADLDIKVATEVYNANKKLFIKRPDFSEYDGSDDGGWIRTLFLDEVRTMEKVSTKPHKNIVKYHGCRIGDGRVKGIVLERYRCTLLEYFQCGGEAIDVAKFMVSLESAVYHIHSLGLAHNDLKPSNIMLDSDDMPVLIDFGSCQPPGARLLTAGTPGWFEEEFNTSATKHDIFALEVLRKWLINPDRKLF